MLGKDDIRFVKETIAPHPTPILSLYIGVNPAKPENAWRSSLVRVKDALKALPIPRDLAKTVIEKLEMVRGEAPRRLLEGRVDHYSNGSQRMILGYSTLRRYVAEHSALLMVHSAHHRHLRLQLLPTPLYTAARKTHRFSAPC